MVHFLWGGLIPWESDTLPEEKGFFSVGSLMIPR